MGSTISKVIIQTVNQSENYNLNNKDNGYKPIPPLSEIITINPFTKKKQEYLYCYVCKLESRIVIDCDNCDVLHDPAEYIIYYAEHDKCEYLSHDNCKLVCHKCFYLPSDDSRVIRMV
jgi:hypothetical protein